MLALNKIELVDEEVQILIALFACDIRQFNIHEFNYLFTSSVDIYAWSFEIDSSDTVD